MYKETYRYVLTDSGFWIALYDAEDGQHRDALKLREEMNNPKIKILIPWPIMYEVLRGGFIKDARRIQAFERDIKNLKAELEDDTAHRLSALEETFSYASKWRVSLVDRIIWEMLAKLRIYSLITFNERDFSDICKRRKIPINYFE